MERYFNIGGPCNPARHYMLPAMARLPQVVSLIGKEQYFVVHAQRQRGKTTAFQALADEINANGEKVALYCSVEAVQTYSEPDKGLPEISEQIRANLDLYPQLFGETVTAADMREAKEKIVRERPGYLNLIWKRAHLPCVDRLVEAIASEKIEMIPIETLRSAEGFGVVRKENGRIVYANEIVKDAIMAYRNPKEMWSA